MLAGDDGVVTGDDGVPKSVRRAEEGPADAYLLFGVQPDGGGGATARQDPRRGPAGQGEGRRPHQPGSRPGTRRHQEVRLPHCPETHRGRGLQGAKHRLPREGVGEASRRRAPSRPQHAKAPTTKHRLDRAVHCSFWNKIFSVSKKKQ